MTESYASALERSLRTADSLKAACTSLRDQSASASVPVLAITSIYAKLQSAKEQVLPIIALDVSQGGSVDLQVVTDNNLINGPADVIGLWVGAFTAGAVVQAEVEAMTPEPVNAPANDPMLWCDPTSGVVRYKSFTPTQTATLRTLLDDVITALTY